MSDAATRTIANTADLERRAIAAWNELVGTHGQLELELLQHETARSILRLHTADGTTVIAKRCRVEVARRERTIYEDVLPKLSLPHLHVHGIVGESYEHAWLFLEDADARAEPYDPCRADHRALAGRWLGSMHVRAAPLPVPELGDRGPTSFREDLRCLSATLDAVRGNPSLTDDDAAVLATIRSQCRIMASHWDDFETLCAPIPRTLVHGDFKEEHIRVRADRSEPAVLLFDWHEAGWGVPVLDAAKFHGYSVRPDVSAYHACMQARWPMMSLETIGRLGFVGEACRALASARWEAEKLRYEWVERPMASLRLYAGWIADVLRAEPWAEHASGGPQARVAKARTWL